MEMARLEKPLLNSNGEGRETMNEKEVVALLRELVALDKEIAKKIEELKGKKPYYVV